MTVPDVVGFATLHALGTIFPLCCAERSAPGAEPTDCPPSAKCGTGSTSAALQQQPRRRLPGSQWD